jgi:hypothetical protein
MAKTTTRRKRTRSSAAAAAPSVSPAPDEKVGGRKRKLGKRIRMLRAVAAEARAMKAEGLTFDSREEALAALLTRFENPRGPAKDLLVGFDFDSILEWIDKLLPIIMAILQMFLVI